MTDSERKQEDNERKAQEDGLNELMLCAGNGDLERIRELVAYGEDVNSQSLVGTTALMYATRNNQLDIVKFLISKGADQNLKSNKGLTAMDIANEFGYTEIIASLKSRHGRRG